MPCRNSAAAEGSGSYIVGWQVVLEAFCSAVHKITYHSVCQVQVGCHADDLSNAKELKRAPVVIRTCDITCQKQSVSCLWGGLIYIIVPERSVLGKVPISVEGAVRAPFFKLGRFIYLGALLSTAHDAALPVTEMKDGAMLRSTWLGLVMPRLSFLGLSYSGILGNSNIHSVPAVTWGRWGSCREKGRVYLTQHFLVVEIVISDENRVLVGVFCHNEAYLALCVLVW